MSNAMRFGKRTLAGVAAGALGAGVLTFVGAPTAMAASGADTQAASLEWTWPSYTIVADTLTDDTFLNPLDVFNDDGDQMDDSIGDDRKVTITIAPASTSVAADDTAINPLGAGTCSSTGCTYASAIGGDVTPYFTYFNFAPNSAGGDWNDFIAEGNLGTSVATAKLIDTSTNTVLDTETFNINVVSAAAKVMPAAALFINATTWSSGNLITSLGQSPTSTSAANVALVDSGFGPFVSALSDDSLVVSSTNASSDTTWSAPSEGAYLTTSGVYTSTHSGSGWSTTKSSGTIVATYYSSGSTKEKAGTLPVSIARYGASDVDSMEVTSTTYYDEASDEYQVPIGTAKVSVGITLTSDDSADKVAWNATESGGILNNVSASGGAAAVTDGSATIELTPSSTEEDDEIYVKGGTYASSSSNDLTIVYADDSGTADITTPVAKINTAASVPGTWLSQFGTVLDGSWSWKLVATTSSACTTTAKASGSVASNGAFTVAVPSTMALAVAGTETFRLCLSDGFDVYTWNFDVYYTTNGEVSSLAIDNGTSSTGDGTTDDLDMIQTLAVPVADPTDLTDQSESLEDIETNTGGAITEQISDDASAGLNLQVEVDPAVSVTVTAPAGIYLTTKQTGTVVLANLKSSLTLENDDTFTVFSTKPGLHKVTATAGTQTYDWNFWAGVPSQNGRVITLEAPSTMGKNEFITIGGTVKDIWGNPVPLAAVSSTAVGGAVAIGSGSEAVETQDDGSYEVVVESSDKLGTGRVKVTDDSTTVADTVYTGYPDLTYTTYKDIQVTDSAPTTKTIVIVGERGTVSGKPGIEVEGDTTGFTTGDTVKPWVRFPGGDYTLGAARPAIDAAGGFSWSRKTGKKSYVYFTSDDEATVSNRVIIAAK